MTRLYVNVDHVATLREARKTVEPDPLRAAQLALSAGAYGITVHLREDRRHIQDADVRRIKDSIQAPLNLEMAAVDEMVDIALGTRPCQVSLVPEKRQEITTEGGLDILANAKRLVRIGDKMRECGILFSLFVDPDPAQIAAAVQVGADSIELNTGRYSESAESEALDMELNKIRLAAKEATGLGLKVFAGHGLTCENVIAIAALTEIEELNIGHSIVSRSVYGGIEWSVREMLASIQKGIELRN